MSEKTSTGKRLATNIALLEYGARAFASSSDSAHCPDNVLSGTTSGTPDKWLSNPESKGPQWLVLDLGHPRKIHKILVKHAGVVENADYNTRDFRLQYASSMDGPWEDIAAPISGNTESITTHEFEPLEVQYIRIYITKPEQKDKPDGRHIARIFNVEVYTEDPVQHLSNVALPRYGTAATASSSSENACKAINNSYSHLHTDKWGSGGVNRSFPHWLVVDFGQPREICKIIVKHAGTIESQGYTTSDFQLQCPSLEDGTWSDIVPPVRGNTDAVTVHSFAPLETQYIRLYITRPSQKEQPPRYLDARIFGIEAYTTQPVEPAPSKITYFKASSIHITNADNENFIKLEVHNDGKGVEAEVRMGIPVLSERSIPVTVPPGVSVHKMKIPETIRHDVPVKLSLFVDGSAQAETTCAIRFTPEVEFTTKYFTIKCFEAHYKAYQARFQEFMRYADACYEAAADILGLTPETPIPIVVQDKQPGSGWSDGRQVAISIFCFSDDKTWEWWSFTVLPHELIHHFLASSKCSFPPWFVEPPSSYLNLEIVARAVAAIGRQDLIELARKEEQSRAKWSKDVEIAAQYIWLDKVPEEYRANTRRASIYMLKCLRDEYGLDIFRKFIHLIIAEKVEMTGDTDISIKNRLMIEYMSKAAGTDLRDFFAQFGFPIELYEMHN